MFSVQAPNVASTVPVTRVEAFLQVVLHLVLIAIAEDRSDEDEMSEESLESFVYIALNAPARTNFLKQSPTSKTIAALLEMLSHKEEYKACHTKISLVLKRMKQKQPRNFEASFARLGVPVDRISTASPANNNVLEDREKKKQAALERQAKVMAQFQQQQRNFLDNQGDIDWGEDDTSDDNLEVDAQDQKTYWQYPSGTCILCQEETKDGRLYGTFALLTPSTILRQTDFKDPDFIREVAKTPSSLDRSADNIRPCGVAGENREQVHKVTASGVEIVSERQFIGKGFPSSSCRSGPVSVGCGHIMHFKCFEVYYEASHRRHQHQIARHHPERLEMNEFVCPLCKALGNAFLPIIWSPKEELSITRLQPKYNFNDWISSITSPNAKALSMVPVNSIERERAFFIHQNSSVLLNSLNTKTAELLNEAWNPPAQAPTPTNMGLLALGPLPPGHRDALYNPALPNAQSPTNNGSPMTELVGIYRRLRETIRKNDLPTRHKKLGIQHAESPIDDLYASDTIAQSLGFSISAVEIQQRGVASPNVMTFLETVPQQALTHLRVLAETAASYICIGGVRAGSRVAREFALDYEDQFQQLFLRPSSIGTGQELTVRDPSIDCLLARDTFIFLTECSLCLAAMDDFDIMHIVKLCYLAELIKVVVKMNRNKGKSSFLSWINYDFEPSNPQGLDAFKYFCCQVRSWDLSDGNHRKEPPSSAMEQPCFDGAESCRAFAKKYALVFLRKVALLLHVRYGVAFNNFVSSDPTADELDRLTEALRLPTFDEMCASIYGKSPLSPLAQGWLLRATCYTQPDSPSQISLSHPAIFELIGLPKNYDTLMEETMKRRCPTTGKDVSDPMLCLFCGVITCGQSICCLKDGPRSPTGRVQQIGGAQQHMLKYVDMNYSTSGIIC